MERLYTTQKWIFGVRIVVLLMSWVSHGISDLDTYPGSNIVSGQGLA